MAAQGEAAAAAGPRLGRKISKRDVDYSLYLVTDSTPAILGAGRDVCDVVREALRGGVTVVQYRDKTADTRTLVATARQLHALTLAAGVPLLINDRVDVALAVRCEGVHIGQDDMDARTARRLLGPDAIIGVTASSVEEALQACRDGADYLGIGTVYATSTKKDTKQIIGTAGVKDVLAAMLHAGYEDTRTVCIGGINAANVQRVLFQGSRINEKRLDGVAVVSAIMAAADPKAAALRLHGLLRLRSMSQFETDWEFTGCLLSEKGAAALVPRVWAAVQRTKPLSHNMTNLVVQNFAANVALAVGASPIMANYGEEAADLARLGGSLVINMGTVTPEGLTNYIKALRAYNEVAGPVVFDPVGAGATAVRRAAVKDIMAAGYLDVIKGNEGEIQTVWGASTSSSQQQQQQRGVDGSSTLDGAARARLVRDLAMRESNVVVMTGATDYVSDGRNVYAVHHGHPLLGQVTGTGCTLGTTISAAVVAFQQKPEPKDESERGDKLGAVIAALILFERAAEIAADRDTVKGPGTFVPVFLDELARCRQLAAEGDMSWLPELRVEQIDLPQ